MAHQPQVKMSLYPLPPHDSPAVSFSPFAVTSARKAGVLIMSKTVHAAWQHSGLPANVEP